MGELSEHCQCDNCTGQDCGQDNPEEYEREREEERQAIRKDERGRVLDVFDELLFDIEQIHQEESNGEDDKLWDKIIRVVELRKTTLREGKGGE